MSEHTCASDLILLGTLPDDLSSAIQEREVQCSVHVAKTVKSEEITENVNDCSNVSTNTDDSCKKSIVEWVDQEEGITWQAELVEWCHKNLTCSLAESTNMSKSLVKGNALYYVILPNSWMRSTHTKLMSSESSESLTSSSEIMLRTAINKHNEFSDEQEERQKRYQEEEEEQLATSPTASQVIKEEVECVIDNNDVTSLQKETCLSSVTGCHLEHFNSFDLLYASEAHHRIIQEILYYLAPTRRYLHEILRYVFVETSLHDEYRAKYSVEDVEYILRYISNVNAMEQYDLNEQGFVKIDIERFDSTRIKQNVANRAFLCLSHQFRRLVLHATDNPNTNVHVEDDAKNMQCKERSDDNNSKESLYAEMAHVLHTMELYADRDVMISARTGGGGIMAGLASHKRLREEDVAHEEQDTIDSDVEEHTECFSASTSNDKKGANENYEIELNASNKDERETISNDDDDAIRTKTTAMGNKVLMSDGDSTPYHSSSHHNQQTNANKINTNRNKNYGYDKHVHNIRKLDNHMEEYEESSELFIPAQRELNANKTKRQVRVTSLSQRGLELHNEDLSTQSTILEIERASENVLQRFTAYYSREHSANAIINSNDVLQNINNDDDTEYDMEKSNSWYNGRKMIIASETEFKTASAIYTQLLECFNDLHKILVRHETFTNSVGRWCAQYMTECATKELITELNSWQEGQRQPRRLLTELYVRLHKATYTMERELEEYVTLKALLLLEKQISVNMISR